MENLQCEAVHCRQTIFEEQRPQGCRQPWSRNARQLPVPPHVSSKTAAGGAADIERIGAIQETIKIYEREFDHFNDPAVGKA